MLITLLDSTVTPNQGQQSSSNPKGKKDYSTTILERKKPPMMTTPSSLCTGYHGVPLTLLQHPDPSQVPERPYPHSAYGPVLRYGPSEAPLEPAEQSPLRSRPPRRGPRQCTTSLPRSRVTDLPSEGRPSLPRSRVTDQPSEVRPSPPRSRPPLGRWN